MNTPFFTIIIASYNAGDKLHKTVKSVMEQTCGDFEIIVKDAMSTDGSLDKLPTDLRIRCMRSRDRGIYDGMNGALPMAKGEFIYFLNCGDVLHDNHVLENVRKNAQTVLERQTDPKRRPLLLYGDVIEMQTGQLVKANPKMTHFAMFRYLPCHQACFYERKLFEKRQFDIRYRVRADYEHFLWCVLRAGADARAMDLTVADYEGGGYSEKDENRRVSAREHREITGQYFTKKELRRYRAYLALSLQPLREKLAQGRFTAALYDRIKNAVYRHKGKTAQKQK